MISTALHDQGFGLQAALSVSDLESDVRTALESAGHDVFGFRSLLLFGQGGSTLFEKHVRANLHRADPFDETSLELVTNWHRRTHPRARFEVVGPGEAILPLGRLAEAVGWGRPSPVGLTINPTFGLWLAHRVVLLSELEPHGPTEIPEHPCDSCADTPCVAACPVDAVSVTGGLDIEACSRHRISSGSECELQCLARNACPVGAEHRYGPDQMRHHYGAGLDSIRRWLEG